MKLEEFLTKTTFCKNQTVVITWENETGEHRIFCKKCEDFIPSQHCLFTIIQGEELTKNILKKEVASIYIYETNVFIFIKRSDNK